MKVQAIIPTAGVGRRLRSAVIKPLVKINGKPLFVYCLQVFERSSAVDSAILVVHRKYLKDFEKNVKKYRLKKVKRIVPGGKTRSASVRNGLRALDRDTDVVLIHDGVRPMVTAAMIKRSVRSCRRSGAVIVALPVKSTIKRLDGNKMVVRETLPREALWEVQTPQVFKKDVLVKAHARAGSHDSTDDAVLVERMGVKVKVVLGDYKNIKVTTQEDVAVVKGLLKHQCG